MLLLVKTSHQPVKKELRRITHKPHQMPIWKHLAFSETRFHDIRCKPALRCLQENHQVRTVQDISKIADQKTTSWRRPHMVDPSGIGRRNCGCPPCQHDQTVLLCNNPGECVEMVKRLLDCILPKWNPDLVDTDLCDELALSEEEILANATSGNEDDGPAVTFNPMFRLTDISDGYRIFASEDHLRQIAMKHYSIPAVNNEQTQV
ncbi:hypothetical protein DFH08DRAFT_677081 [Mycena albidolilacea]|uniref:Uncharacterized protein n=1 Tax=Mycena albidolilacea TaxID=1033008 RepID=A0AAD7F646_9AGAR|nr:hypothetical protein DFH08DRAFT_677081 [Mycena albidolilacea]